MKEYYFVQLFIDISGVESGHRLYYNSDFQQLCMEVNFKNIFRDIYDNIYDYINASFEYEFKDSLDDFIFENNLTAFIDEKLSKNIENKELEEISCKLYDYIISINIPNSQKLKLICEYINEIVINSAIAYGYEDIYEIFAGDAINFATYFFEDLLNNIECECYLEFKPFKKRIEGLCNLCKERKFPLTDIHLGILLEWTELFEIVMQDRNDSF